MGGPNFLEKVKLHVQYAYVAVKDKRTNVSGRAVEEALRILLELAEKYGHFIDNVEPFTSLQKVAGASAVHQKNKKDLLRSQSCPPQASSHVSGKRPGNKFQPGRRDGDNSAKLAREQPQLQKQNAEEPARPRRLSTNKRMAINASPEQGGGSCSVDLGANAAEQKEDEDALPETKASAKAVSGRGASAQAVPKAKPSDLALVAVRHNGRAASSKKLRKVASAEHFTAGEIGDDRDMKPKETMTMSSMKVSKSGGIFSGKNHAPHASSEPKAGSAGVSNDNNAANSRADKAAKQAGEKSPAAVAAPSKLENVGELNPAAVDDDGNLEDAVSRLLAFMGPLLNMSNSQKQHGIEVEKKCRKWLADTAAKMLNRVRLDEDGEDREEQILCDETSPEGVLASSFKTVAGLRVLQSRGSGSFPDHCFRDEVHELTPLAVLQVVPGWTPLSRCTSCGYVLPIQYKNQKRDFFSMLRYKLSDETDAWRRICRMCRQAFAMCDEAVVVKSESDYLVANPRPTKIDWRYFSAREKEQAARYADTWNGDEVGKRQKLRTAALRRAAAQKYAERKFLAAYTDREYSSDLVLGDMPHLRKVRRKGSVSIQKTFRSYKAFRRELLGLLEMQENPHAQQLAESTKRRYKTARDLELVGPSLRQSDWVFRTEQAGICLVEILTVLPDYVRRDLAKQFQSTCEDIWGKEMLHNDLKMDNLCVKLIDQTKADRRQSTNSQHTLWHLTFIDFGSALILRKKNRNKKLEQEPIYFCSIGVTWPFLEKDFCQKYHEAVEISLAASRANEVVSRAEEIQKLICDLRVLALQEAFCASLVLKFFLDMTNQCYTDTAELESGKEDEERKAKRSKKPLDVEAARRRNDKFREVVTVDKKLVTDFNKCIAKSLALSLPQGWEYDD
ncbi:unnamed protein product [Amoebophrya sp. A120]|nr:unnamed protein product [Amoebophrya sp. A120]|eukprot:GSA120T00020648001.1